MDTLKRLFNRHFVRPIITTKAFYDVTKTQTLWYEAHEVGKGFYTILQLHASKTTVSMDCLDKGDKYTREQVAVIFSDLEKELSSYEEAPHRPKPVVTEINGRDVTRKKRAHYSLI